MSLKIFYSSIFVRYSSTFGSEKGCSEVVRSRFLPKRTGDMFGRGQGTKRERGREREREKRDGKACRIYIRLSSGRAPRFSYVVMPSVWPVVGRRWSLGTHSVLRPMMVTCGGSAKTEPQDFISTFYSFFLLHIFGSEKGCSESSPVEVVPKKRVQEEKEGYRERRVCY